jgi:hypothetical protein
MKASARADGEIDDPPGRGVYKLRFSNREPAPKGNG